MATSTQSAPTSLPRVAITYCTQCRWLLRAAYFAQELLSTFGTQIGEVALVPATGGVFTVALTYVPKDVGRGGGGGGGDGVGETETETVLLWDRKAEGGFPEPKVLKQRVRDWIDPGRDLGHSDVGGRKGGKKEDERAGEVEGGVKETRGDIAVEKKAEGGLKEGEVCEDCK
ncbi:hypothetical protein PMIN04_009475 [Paraphaeosphaeria minitans]|uniref:SelT/selW/selH selenoprotein domain-containing protein n=1 Tax=Paraphaeosphaeria minitans TaxID=565426 RepID=A0A9P6GGZ9_9PLEO|nr:selT/selW/selH selenoprotein domain-containing protein [Paraphaeosphaeria minitans]